MRRKGNVEYWSAELVGRIIYFCVIYPFGGFYDGHQYRNTMPFDPTLGMVELVSWNLEDKLRSPDHYIVAFFKDGRQLLPFRAVIT